MIITLPVALENSIREFVLLNGIEDVNSFLVICLRDGFNIAKYGASPMENVLTENKPIKIERYDDKEKPNVERIQREENIEQVDNQSISTKEEKIEPKKEDAEVKPKRKIRITKK